ISGRVNSASAGGMEMAVQLIGLRAPAAFNFAGAHAGGGAADPAHYQVLTGSIDLSGLSVGSPLRGLGFVAPFGSAPPDFAALSVVDVAGVAALLEVAWSPGATADIVKDGDAKLDRDFTDSPVIHHVVRVTTSTDLTSFPAVSVEPAGSSGIYSIRDAGT